MSIDDDARRGVRKVPTSTGLPKKGERVAFRVELPSNGEKPERRYGTVVERGAGDYWTLYVRWDKPHPADTRSIRHGSGVAMIVDASYHLKMGWLKIVQ